MHVQRRRRISRDPAERFIVDVTFDLVTPESAADGDVEDRGYEVEDSRENMRGVLRLMSRYGPWEDGEVSDGEVSGDRRVRENALVRFYGSDSETVNWRTGAEKSYAIHIRGTERAIDRLIDVLEANDYDVNGRVRCMKHEDCRVYRGVGRYSAKQPEHDRARARARRRRRRSR